jgi:hypothetical protein
VRSLNLLMASSATGMNRLTRLLSGSRNRMERFPHGIVVGSCTHSFTTSRSNSLSTSSTRNSMMTVWLSAGHANFLNGQVVRVWPKAMVQEGRSISAKTGADQIARIPVTCSQKRTIGSRSSLIIRISTLT